MHSLYSRHLKNHTGTRRARPRSVFNVRLFNGNLESFIQVLSSELPARYRSTSFLFSLCVWLSRHFMAFPHSLLASIYFENLCAKVDCGGNLPHCFVSPGALRSEGCRWFLKGCRRGGAGLGGRSVSLPASASLTSCDPAPGVTKLVWQREMLSFWREWKPAVQLVRQAADFRPMWCCCCCRHPPPGHFTASHRGSCLGDSFGGQLSVVLTWVSPFLPLSVCLSVSTSGFCDTAL